MKHFLSCVSYEGKDETKLIYDNDIVFPFSKEALEAGKIFP